MNWDATTRTVAAFIVAALAVWFAADLLGPLGLGEFAFVGQLCFAILLLSALDAVFIRFAGAADHPPPPSESRD